MVLVNPIPWKSGGLLRGQASVLNIHVLVFEHCVEHNSKRVR